MNTTTKSIIVTALDKGYTIDDGRKVTAIKHFGEVIEMLHNFLRLSDTPIKGKTNDCRITITIDYNLPKPASK